MRFALKRGILLVLLLTLLLPASLKAQRSREIALIGKIDLRAVLLLHPVMASYDPEKLAFKVDTSRVSPQLQQQKAGQHQASIDSLSAEIKSIQAKMQEFRRNHTRKMQELSAQYLDKVEEIATGPAGMRRQQYLIDSNRAEATFNARLQALSGQLSLAETRLDRLTRISYHVGYTDPEETQRKFLAVLNEVRQITQQVAAQKNVQVVLNSSLSAMTGGIERSQPVMPPELDYGKVFNVPFPREIANDAAAVAGYYGNITSMAGNWLFHGDKVLSPFKGILLANDVFIGGVDLTGEVLVAIFKNYKIDANIGNAIIQAISAN